MPRLTWVPFRSQAARSSSACREAGSASLFPLVLLVYVVLAASYFVVRFAGHWAEVDTAAQALAVRSMAESHALVPEVGDVYPNGYGYVALSNAVLAFTGLSVPVLQQIVSPLASAFLVFPAWALFRELTGTRRAAALATLLLFLQPEFLFVVLRGSHERVLRGLMMVALWLLVRSFRYRDRTGYFAVHVALFYLSAFGLIATNTFFGISFVVACAIGMGAAWALSRGRPELLAVACGTAGRLASVVMAAATLGFVFVFYLYTPATQALHALHDVANKLSALLLTTEGGYNPYRVVATAWTSLPVYFLVSISDYLLIAVSAVVWIWQGLRWLRHLERPASVAAWLLWLLYGAFAFQGALSAVVDLSGSLGGNLQHRSFPSFALVATPLVASALSQWRPPRWTVAFAGAPVAALAGLALIKATNEPVLSNKWIFYGPAEIDALAWADQHHRSDAIWVGPDERLSTAFDLAVGRSARNNQRVSYDPKDGTRSFLISAIARLQSARLQKPLPAVAMENRVYDSGAAQLYHLRARTPYQE